MRSRVQLAQLSDADLLAFGEYFDRHEDRAYDFSLWGAAYLILGGCGDDTFSDFRACLISCGKAAYERALADPDSLAEYEIDAEQWYYEGYQYAFIDAWRSRQPKPAAPRWFARHVLGQALPDVAYPPRYAPGPHEPAGRRWTDNELPELYPRLWARFG